MLNAGFQTTIQSVTVSKVTLATHRLVALKVRTCWKHYM